MYDSSVGIAETAGLLTRYNLQRQAAEQLRPLLHALAAGATANSLCFLCQATNTRPN